MEKDLTVIKRVNDVDILTFVNERLIPIRPLCDAMGIDPEPQRKKINAHYLLGSTASLRTAVAADGKERKMLCLPLQYVFGWLLTINPLNVSDESREGLMKYQKECYRVLYDYFFSRMEFVEHKQKEIDKQLDIVTNARSEYKTAKGTLAEAENKLKQLRSMTMEDYKMERRQLNLFE